MRSVFSVSYYRGSEQEQAFVLAPTVGEAASFLGVSDGQCISMFEVHGNVESTELDKPHAKIEPTPSKVLPPYVPLFSPDELEQLKAHFTREEIAHVRSKLTIPEIAELRVKAKRLSPAEVEHWKSELKTREHRYVYCHQ